MQHQDTIRFRRTETGGQTRRQSFDRPHIKPILVGLQAHLEVKVDTRSPEPYRANLARLSQKVLRFWTDKGWLYQSNTVEALSAREQNSKLLLFDFPIAALRIPSGDLGGDQLPEDQDEAHMVLCDSWSALAVLCDRDPIHRLDDLEQPVQRSIPGGRDELGSNKRRRGDGFRAREDQAVWFQPPFQGLKVPGGALLLCEPITSKEVTTVIWQPDPR